MNTQVAQGCEHCLGRSQEKLGFDFTMAFQPIVDLAENRVFAQEALVRGPGGEGAGTVLSRVSPENRYAFDQRCRVEAISEARRIGLKDTISINFMPNAIYEPSRCIKSTLAAAKRHGWPLDRIIFEFTEKEQIDTAHLRRIFDEYHRFGFRIAVDDFGAGYSGFQWLADLRPDIVKIDMHLIRGVDRDDARRAIVRGLAGICSELDISLIAEGVETEAELETLRAVGVRLIQGYLLARPSLGRPAEVRLAPHAPAI